MNTNRFLLIQLENLEKQKQTKSKPSKQQKILKIRGEIDETQRKQLKSPTSIRASSLRKQIRMTVLSSTNQKGETIQINRIIDK